MKNFISSFLLLICFSITAHSQITPSKRTSLPKYNIFDLHEYTIEASVIDLYVIKYIISKNGNTENQKEFTLSPNTLEAFEENFKRYIGELAAIDTILSAKITSVGTNVTNEAKRLFYFFIASERAIESFEDAPDAGKLCYNQHVEVNRDLYSIRDFNKDFRRLKRRINDVENHNTKVKGRWLSGEMFAGIDFKNSAVVKELSTRIKNSVTPDALTGPTKNSFLTKETQKIIGKNNGETDEEWRKRIGEFIQDSVTDEVISEIILQNQKLQENDKKYARLYRTNYESDKQWRDEIKKTIKQGRDMEVTSKIHLAKQDFESENNKLITARSIIASQNQENKDLAIALQKKVDTLNIINKMLNDVNLEKQKLINEVIANVSIPESQRPKGSFFDNYQIYITDIVSQIKATQDRFNETDLKLRQVQSQIASAQTDTSRQINNSVLLKLKTDSLLLTVKHKALEDLKNKIDSESNRIKTTTQELEEKRSKSKTDSEALLLQIDAVSDSLNTIVRDTLAISLTLKDKCGQLAEIKRNELLSSFKVERIQIEFNDGFMENIVVEGELDYGQEVCSPAPNGLSNYLKFNNRYPIGFSRKKDIDKYKEYYQLFAKKAGRSYKLPLSSVFPEFIEELKVDRRDFSPDDQVVTLDFENGQCKVLKKEQFYRIFEAKIYSDFVGFIGDDKPNGLVQTEISKRVNLLTYKRAARFFGGRLIFGGLGYIEPEVTISKIESNNKRLELRYQDNIINGVYTPVKYASTLDIRQFQNFSTGFDLNLLVWDVPSFKSTFYGDIGFRYGRTSMVDSTRALSNNVIGKTNLAETYGVNTLEVYPKVNWEIRSDERYSFMFSWSQHWLYLRDLRFEQVANNEDFELNRTDPADVRYRLNKIVLQAKLKPNVNNKGSLFFRYQMHWQQGYWRSVFSQAQVGYSFYILANRN